MCIVLLVLFTLSQLFISVLHIAITFHLIELETTYPAEFLTIMHMGNEDEHKMSSSDSDRFLAMYRLHGLYTNGVITQDAFQANNDHLSCAVIRDSVWHGLGNLLRSPELSAAVARVLEYPHLQDSFNASTWGKKLVKGHFFQVKYKIYSLHCPCLMTNS